MFTPDSGTYVSDTFSPSQAGPVLELRDVSKHFGAATAVDDVSLAVRPGEFFSLLGPSGCGKTTTLRLIAGFEQPDSGEIRLNGQSATGRRPYERPVSMVFQNYALFPHLTVGRNVAFGLERRRVPGAEIERRVAEALELVRLPGFASRDPSNLSGGQRQRVALARALVLQEPILLLDEPLGALDLKLRKQMQLELKALQRELGTTFIYVTHDQEEALTMSDRIAVMSGGRVQQVGAPMEMYERPRTRFVADFIGSTNLLEGFVCGVADDRVELDCPGWGRVIVARESSGSGPSMIEAGSRMEVAIRPEHLRLLAPESSAPSLNRTLGTIRDRIYLGDHFRYPVRLADGAEVVVSERRENAVNPDRLWSGGDRVSVAWAPADGVLLPVGS